MLLRLRSPSPRQHDHRLYGSQTADLLQNREAIHSRHFQVKHDDIGTPSPKHFQALLSTISENHVISLSPEDRVEETPYTLFIINHENFGHGPLGQLMSRSLNPGFVAV